MKDKCVLTGECRAEKPSCNGGASGSGDCYKPKEGTKEPNDDAKEAIYWHALLAHERPGYLPTKVRLPRQIMKLGVRFGPGDFDCNACATSGTIQIIAAQDADFIVLVGTGEFEPIEWIKNEVKEDGGPSEVTAKALLSRVLEHGYSIMECGQPVCSYCGGPGKKGSEIHGESCLFIEIKSFLGNVKGLKDA